MKCLVLGGGGFLGTHLCGGLARRGYPVRVFERFPAPAGFEGAEWVVGDFTQPEQVEAALPGCGVVFHLVSTTLPKSSNEAPVFDVRSNLVGTLELLESARRLGVAKVVFVSSGGTVYGIPRRTPIGEDHPTDPLCSYGITKLATEKYLHLYHALHGLEYRILRPANPYGEGQHPDREQGAVSVFLHRILRGLPIEVWGEGAVVRDYIHVADVVEAMIAAAFTPTLSRIFNIGSGQGTSLLELIAAIETVTSRKALVAFKPGRPFDVPRSVLDISRARDELGWHPRVTLTEGLRRTSRWLLSERACPK
jgi:UDP-glucose 4-epimerase